MKLRKSIVFILTFFITLMGITANTNAATYLISMSKVSISNILDQKYTGRYIEPDVIVRYNGKKLTQGRDYTITYSNNRNVGTARVKVTGRGNYSGSRTINFKIVDDNDSNSSEIVSMAKITVDSIPNQTYTGRYIEPSITVRYNGKILREGRDYTLTYSNNRNVGYGSVKIVGNGNYSGARTVGFKIVSNSNYDNNYNRISISRATVSNILNQVYTGKYIEPEVVVRYNGTKLTQGRDYTITYSNNRKIGTATVKIAGKGNYTGSKTITFNIVRSGFSSSYSGTISMNRVNTQRIEEQYYTGRYIEPTVVLTFEGKQLREGRDYTITYSNNKNVGSGKIYIKGIGNYSGTKTIYFQIKGNSIPISQATVNTILNQTYTGTYIRPSITVKYDGERLTEGIDYTLSYINNKNVGNATVKITGKGNYKGTKNVTFKIVNRSSSSSSSSSSNRRISMSNVTVSHVLNQLYTGNSIRPSIVARYNGRKLAQGIDYTVSYSNNRNIGTATIKITGRGNYTGTKMVTFKIVRR